MGNGNNNFQRALGIILMKTLVCKECGTKIEISNSVFEREHSIRHAFDSLTIKPETRKILYLILEEFELTLDDATETGNKILTIMGEDQRLDIKNVFEIEKKK